MAPQAKPPAGRGFGGSAPNYSKQNLDKDLMLQCVSKYGNVNSNSN